jgi:hypothetical protein
LCDNLLLQKNVQSLCENTVFLCVYLIDPSKKLHSDSDLAGLEASILERINHLIEEINAPRQYSNCWPRDWLSPDLNKEIPGVRFRVLGVNYESLFSSWEKEKFNDRELKAGIKEHAVNLMEQLKAAHVGERPIVWVSWRICHNGIGMDNGYYEYNGLFFKEILFFVPPKIVCAHPNVICCTQLRFN